MSKKKTECIQLPWLVIKPDKSPVHFPAGFYFDDYPVSQDLVPVDKMGLAP